jgi:hypothetical protein
MILGAMKMHEKIKEYAQLALLVAFIGGWFAFWVWYEGNHPTCEHWSSVGGISHNCDD